MTPIDTQSPHPGSVIQKSLALNALLQALPNDRMCTILDLGPARGINVDFWSQVADKIYIEDFYRTWISSAAPAPPENAEEEPDYDAVFNELLTFTSDARMDVILAWDLFNYFEPRQIEAAVRLLGRFCRPGTFLFALIWSTHQMPSEPTTFKILDRARIIYESAAMNITSCPHYQPRDVGKMMVGFQVFNSFILRNGIQEYLFVYDGPS